MCVCVFRPAFNSRFSYIHFLSARVTELCPCAQIKRVLPLHIGLVCPGDLVV